MAERPIHPAREEGAGRALLVVFCVALVCATLVSAAAVLLEPAREANRAAERDAFLRALVADVPGVRELLGEESGRLEARVVDLATGEHAPADDAAVVAGDAVAGDEEVEIPSDLDVARLRRRPPRAVVYLLQRAGAPSLIVLPVSGRGYGGVIRGYLALEGDANFVAALTITGHSETPGIGARITEPEWLETWRGKQVLGPDGRVSIRVVKAAVDPDSPEAPQQVHGITGATRTNQGVTNMLRYWLGEHGFGPFLDELRAQGAAS